MWATCDHGAEGTGVGMHSSLFLFLVFYCQRSDYNRWFNSRPDGRFCRGIGVDIYIAMHPNRYIYRDVEGIHHWWGESSGDIHTTILSPSLLKSLTCDIYDLSNFQLEFKLQIVVCLKRNSLKSYISNFNISIYLCNLFV